MWIDIKFVKVFGKLDYGMISRQFHHLGFARNLRDWLHDFLNGKSQTTAANGDQYEVTSILCESSRELY